MRTCWYNLLALIAICTLVACSDDALNNSGDVPKVLRIGPLPDHSAATMREVYQPLLTYLEQKTGIKTELVIANSYTQLMELFQTKQIDMANFGGVTYVQANQKYNAVPIVLRDVDEKFSSVVLVRTDSKAKSLQDLARKSFSFGSRLSTSGHLMPRYFFIEKDIEAEIFFSVVRYSGAHDKTAYWVRDRQVDAGVANAGIIQQMYEDGRLKSSDVRILWESPNFPDYVWAVQDTLSKSVRQKIANAFLDLSAHDPQQKRILSNLGAGYYIPASHVQFSTLETIMAKLSARGILND